MKVLRISLISLLFLMGLSGYNQDTIKEKIFTKGQPILRVFANFHTGLSGPDPRSAFELERAYFGYQANIDKSFIIKILLDVGSPDDISEFSKIRRYAYFKNACLTYNYSFLRVDFGLIDMTHFKLQEAFWGYRYIEKSFADRFRFGPSADLGLDFVFTVTPNLKIDLTFSNGEGYSNLQRDNILKAGLGLEGKLFKDLSYRLYSDVMTDEITETTGVLFAGYKFRKIFSIGAEYNWKLNEGYNKGNNRWGYSAYARYFLPLNLELFARYDFVRSSLPDDSDIPWDLARDGSSLIGGIQYQPVPKVNIALNYRDWYPYAKNLENRSFIYLNLEFKY